MPRDPSPLDRGNHEPDSPYTPDRFEGVDLREGDQDRSGGPRGPRGRKHHDRDPAPHILSIRGRAILYDRDRAYRMTLGQIPALCDLAKFRIIAVHDLTEFVYRNRQERAVPELRNLARQGLLRTAFFQGPEGIPKELATLTKAGSRLVLSNRLVPPEQSIYSGFVKPKEANHDADCYRMYQEEAARIEAEGGEPVRVVIDSELKKNINRDVARYGRSAMPEIAARHGLSVVRGKIPIPDLQIEYATCDGDVARVSLELVTEHYRGRSVGQKVRAGFKLYTPHGETDRLRRLLDQHELTAEILSL
jgi:hypothetical protein